MGSIFYKFLTPDFAIKVLEEKRLKVSLMTELNDIYDCAPVFNSPMGAPGGNGSKDSNYFLDRHAQMYGLLCFSQATQSPLLWGHYAASSTGLALGFASEHFDREDALMSTGIKVKYEHKRPLLNPPSENRSESQMYGLIQDGFATKAKEWEYEREIRYIVGLAKCQLQSGRYFAPFCLRSLREIVIGCRSPITSTYLTHFLDTEYRGAGISLHIAKAHPEKYEVLVEAVPPNQPASGSQSSDD